ncbi:MAG: hypothetical protein C0624_02995 [Desulfuromonas sp.]|nr:MAG: hypothetical protein C0624_02995 [Desulfuromonas sp.]
MAEVRKNWVVFTLLPWLAAGLIRLIHMLVRSETIGLDSVKPIWKKGESVIISFWHDQLLLMASGYQGPGTRILISRSKDGELIARTMEFLGQGAVRGSSSRGGPRALREMVRLAKTPYDLAITPDGPKGPRHEAKEGVAQLAKLTRRAIVPMAFVASRGHRFASWDRFLLPYPFCRAVYAYGEPLYCGENETFEDFHVRVQKALDLNTQRAIDQLERHGVSAV